MVTLDDRLLGEKLQNYCSSSEDEDGKDDDDSGDEGKGAKSSSKFIPASELDAPSSSSGFTERTGPKGVIHDWRRFKQLETEKREEQEKERLELIKKLSMTCRSHLDEEEAKKKEQEEEFFDAEDEFFKEYRAKLMQQMQERFLNSSRFGQPIELNRDDFTRAIDEEKKNVTVIVHVYEQNIIGCKTMNECLVTLAEQYPYVKFCRIQASQAQMSSNFIRNGCPALLVYRGGELLTSFVSVVDKLEEGFVVNDVENLLQEHGYLSSAECVKTNTVRDSQISDKNSTNSDDD